MTYLNGVVVVVVIIIIILIVIILLLFGMWTWVGLSRCVLDGVHTVATWRKRLNYPCVAVMQPYVKLL